MLDFRHCMDRCVVRFRMRDEMCALRCIRYEYTVQSAQSTAGVFLCCVGARRRVLVGAVSARDGAPPVRRVGRGLQVRNRRARCRARGRGQRAALSACSSSRGASCPSSSTSANNSSSTLRCASALDECASGSASYTSLFSLAIYLAHLKTLLAIYEIFLNRAKSAYECRLFSVCYGI